MKYVLIIFLICLYCLEGNSQNSNFRIRPIIGQKIHYLTSIQGERLSRLPLSFSILYGLELSHRNLPIAFRYNLDAGSRAIATYPVTQWGFVNTPLLMYHYAHNFEGVYQFKKFGVGAGFFLDYYTTIGAQVFDWPPLKNNGVYFLFSKKYDFINIEFRTRVGISPDIGALWPEHHSLSFSYYFDKEPQLTKSKNYKLNFLVGAKIFRMVNELSYPDESRSMVGSGVYYGLELFNQKYKTSLLLEKDIHATFNAASKYRFFKSYINGTSLSLLHHIKLNNSHQLRLGLGVTWIDDPSVISNNLLLGNTEFPTRAYDFIGLVPIISYELYKNVDVGIRVPYAIKYDSRQESAYNLKRSGLVICFRL